MKFVAPEQAPEQAEIIRNTPFWPDVDLSEFRSVMRTDGTVTQPRLKQVAEHGPFLPHGLQVELPDIPITTTVQTVQLWD